MSRAHKQKISALLKPTSIKIDGNGLADIKILNEKFYKRVLMGGSLALGESYMDGWWQSKTIDQFIYEILRKGIDKKVIGNINTASILIKSALTNMQRKSRAFEIGEKHYDTGNNLFSLMLDKRMNYSCAYWKDAKNLDEAQEKKLELICKKINLKPGERVLDIGCGWGGFLKYAAEKYSIKGVGITVSEQQAEYARKNVKGLTLDIRLMDYRDINEKFDKIVSVGMMEHVGKNNYRKFMKVAYKNLKDDGLFLLHTIGGNKSVMSTDPWTHKYIFPRGMLPSIKQLGKSFEGLFTMEDWHNFGADYDKTLMAWHSNFSKNWDKIKKQYEQNNDDGERFRRMWSYYLLSCAGSFRARHIQLWQIVLSKKGVEGGYKRLT